LMIESFSHFEADSDRGMAFVPEGPRKNFWPRGSAQPLEKAQFRQENPRKSKPFFFDWLGSGLARLCWIWLNLASALKG
jgi:hypothetical protein